MAKFYMIDCMFAKDFLAAYPANYMLPDFVINKLAEDINPFNGRPATFIEYKQFFNNLNASKAQQQSKVQMMEVKN